jgi:prolyl oligopeptidase
LVVISCITIFTTTAVAEQNSATRQLHKIFETEWQLRLKSEPTFASWLGDKRYGQRWSDVSLKSKKERHEHKQTVLKQLDKIDQSQLSKADRINFELFRREYQTSVDAFPFGWHLVPLNQRSGIQDANSLADSLQFDKVKDYTDWIARLESFPNYMDQTIELMKEGVSRGIVQTKIVMKRVPGQIKRQIVENPERSLFYKPFRDMPDSINDATQAKLQARARSAIKNSIVPSYKKMLTFFEETYLPACLDKPGVSQFPNGQAFYAHRARSYTTTDLTPKQIHAIGLSEVARIRKEMEKIVKQVKFEGTFREFLNHLRTDRKFYFSSANELLAAYREVCMRIHPKLVSQFRKLPRIPYGVEPIPTHLAPDTTTAYYRPPSADGRRAGTYFVNLYKPEVRPKYEIEVLSVHEAMPGHHLQIALAMELEGVPEFRRFSGYTAFVEGWGLYSESLGTDLGLYKDPYSKFGQLTYEMWRAVRLVIDTGLHSFGWSRDRAIEFFAANTAKTLLDIENEVDRYISWPGQALAYKIGELKIQELRKLSENQLGDDFDVREFHDIVLQNGAVTLDVLERIVKDWLASKAAKREP